jgi:4-diphosphocytidyl-2-C-methyl-D-erythritol kinase
MVKLLAERAVAKINLFLRVTGRRADGYHELDSVFLPIALADTVSIEFRGDAERSVRILCDAPGLGDSANNLASRAAQAFLDEFQLNDSALIRLDKQIPVGAGLGGGSSDAGAVLRMLSRLARVDAPERLHRIAIGLGADVPFFLDPRPARVAGIGEQITPLNGVATMPLVLAVPHLEVATAGVFRALKKEHWSGRADDADIAAIVRGEVTTAIAVNDLASVAAVKHPQIAKLMSILEMLGARAAQMTGSGSAVFGIFPSKEDADLAVRHAKFYGTDATFIATESISSASTSILDAPG